VQMECANDNPQFLKMVANWATPQIEALLSEQALSVNPNVAVAHTHHGHHHHHHDDHHHHHNGHGHHHH